MRNRFGLWVIVAFTALVVNPNLACSDGTTDEEFEYGEADMQAAVLGNWSGNLIIGDREETFTLVLEQASTDKSTQSAAPQPDYRLQCSSRSFIKPAAACWSRSDMPLIGKITSSEGTFTDTVVSGSFSAGPSLSPGNLQLEFGPNYFADATYKDGKFELGMVRSRENIAQGSFLLQR